jgi:acyl-CoA-binding protein
MKSKRELFDLAKMYATLEMNFEEGLASEFEMDELKYNMEKIRNVLLEKKYDVDMFLKYKALYKQMSVGEYFEFIKTLE